MQFSLYFILNIRSFHHNLFQYAINSSSLQTFLKESCQQYWPLTWYYSSLLQKGIPFFSYFKQRISKIDSTSFIFQCLLRVDCVDASRESDVTYSLYLYQTELIHYAMVHQPLRTVLSYGFLLLMALTCTKLYSYFSFQFFHTRLYTLRSYMLEHYFYTSYS
jgi:hypothetical protein